MDATRVTGGARIPLATYRLQLNRRFAFEQAAELVDYLELLGISDAYVSPLLAARPGSDHGYDVVDHSRLNPDLGTKDELEVFARRLRERGMGLLLDVVPNHMCIATVANRWWTDVLENGPSSPQARCFDIDWDPPKTDLVAKVLLPVLGEQYGRVLENKEIQINFADGAFTVSYFDLCFPLAPKSSVLILEPALADLSRQLGEEQPEMLELESIVTALRHLPPRTETGRAKVRERQREKDIIRQRLTALVERSAEVKRAVLAVVHEINGEQGKPESFDRLEVLLAEQGYRLSFWRVATDEINYRRFFDINELAAIRVEEPWVFNAVHEVIIGLVRRGLVTGLRVDHIDGLLDPDRYLRALQRAAGGGTKEAARRSASAARAATTAEAGRSGAGANGGGSDERRPLYLVVEKILGREEHLPALWPVHGTTGYELMDQLGGVFVDPEGAWALRDVYERFTGERVRFADVVYQSKKLILSVAMSSELTVLARKLDRISEQHRYSRDFTLNSLQKALAEVIACFPVYRTYIRPEDAAVSEEDRLQIETAIRAAVRRNPATSESIFRFLRSLLLLEHPESLDETELAERRDFVLRFQQLTAPVTAKGVEDTAFYRYAPLAALNEVGSHPDQFGVSVSQFHQRNAERLALSPHGLSATSTHDTKRSEDVRARILVLSEMPERWDRALQRWRELNRPLKTEIGGSEVPDANEEYLLYQTLVGIWPLDGSLPDEPLVRRVQSYMNKAIKEAKLHTSWISPNQEHEEAVERFIQLALSPETSGELLTELDQFCAAIRRPGLLGALSQVLLKIASPGAPDFYQGSELWDFSLVDPDNRRTVDYELRRLLLREIVAEGEKDPLGLARRLLAQMEDGRIKLFLTRRALDCRRRQRALFEQGSYLPLFPLGERAEHVIAFARADGDRSAVVIAGRFFARLGAPPDGAAWGETLLPLPEGAPPATYRDALTGQVLRVMERGGVPAIHVGSALAHLPVALLEGSG